MDNMADVRSLLRRKAEKMGWNWRDCSDGSVELETWSPAGEDIVVYLPGEDIAKEMRVYAANFDIDEHVEPLVECRGQRGVPSSIRTLVEDAEEIQKMLNDLSDAFDEVVRSPWKNVFEKMNCPDCGEEVLARVTVNGEMPVRTCPKCGTVHETHRWYREVDREKLEVVIDTKEPRGLFLCDTGIEIIGVDNTTGDAKTEEFPDRLECLIWLLHENEEGD